MATTVCCGVEYVDTIMLRTAFKLLLALALIIQGSVGAFAHQGAHAAKMPCHHLDENGKPAKMPCCPDGCAADDGCTACVLVFVPPMAAPTLRIVSAPVKDVAAATSFEPLRLIPPTRPPIS
jgi:hypothetical protein